VLFWKARPGMLRAGAEAPEKWIVHKRLYDHGWLCVRCGHTWVPETEASALTC